MARAALKVALVVWCAVAATVSSFSLEVGSKNNVRVLCRCRLHAAACILFSRLVVPSRSMQGAGMRIELSPTVPRPQQLMFGTERLDPPSGEVPNAAWWPKVPNAGFSNYTRGGFSKQLIGGNEEHQVAQCNQSCLTAGVCAGWTLVKGQFRGTCYLFAAEALVERGYQLDTGLVCGSWQPVTQENPRGTQTAYDCVDLTFANRTVQHCPDPKGGQVDLRYTQVNASHVTWTWEIAGYVVLTGSMQVQRASHVDNTSLFVWGLDSTTTVHSRDGPLLYADFKFALTGFSQPNDTFWYSVTAKEWCVPGHPCGEWSFTRTTSNFPFAGVAPAYAPSIGWQPPYIPPQEAALLERGRSDVIGGWRPGVGVSAWSTQRTLPFALRGTTDGTVMGLGLGRIGVELRCGSQLPYQTHFGFFTDLSMDGQLGTDDLAIFRREMYPVADWFYRSSLIMKIGGSGSLNTLCAALMRVSRFAFSELFVDFF